MKLTLTTILVLLSSQVFGAEQLTTEELYKKFNMRSVYSSYGQRLKYYCNSYPKEFFTEKEAKFVSDKRLELVSGDDVWVFTIVEPNVIYLRNQITSGTYNSGSKHELYFDAQSKDWKSKETYIDIPEDCVPFKASS